MKISLLGHASIFVETSDCKFLMDPVFADPFCEGLNASCPQREIFVDRVPSFDFLIISHQHLDHFDIRTLAQLPKGVDVLVPPDKLIINTLKQLGYRNIYPLKDFDKVKCGGTTIMTTRSEVRVPEFGIVFADPLGVFWNTVDTFFTPSTIQKVRDSYPTIDFLLATWHISMETRYQANGSLEFPFELYGKLFKLYSLIEPKAIAPGACGWKYINESAWQNQIVFPVTRERFCHDYQQAFPSIGDQLFTFNPGDIIQLEGGVCTHHPASCDFARMMVDDRDCLDYDPVNVGNPLVDSNPERYDSEMLSHELTQAIETTLPEFIQANRNSLFAIHRHWSVVYQLTVTFPTGDRQWHIDFADDILQIRPGRNPLANLFTSVTASSLYSLIHRKRGWDYIWCSGEYRTFQKIYRMTAHGILHPANGEIIDPLNLQYPLQHTAGGNLATDIERWGTAANTLDDANSPGYDHSMIPLGSLYVKRRKDLASHQV